MNNMLYLKGYFGRGNIGDDWMLKSLLDSEVLNDFGKIVIDSPQPLYGLPCCPMVYNKGVLKSFFINLKRLRQFDKIMVFGGTQFFETPTHRMSLWLDCILLLCASFNRNLYLIGIGVGRLDSRVSRVLFYVLFKRSRQVVFRDYSSPLRAGLTMNMGYHIGCDPIFLSLTKSREFDKTTDQRTYINIKSLDKYGFDEINPNLINQIDINNPTWISAQSGVDVVPVNADYLVYTTGNIRDFIQLKGELAIVTRYHLALHFLLVGTPTLCFNYQPKVEAIFNELNLSEFLLKPTINVADLKKKILLAREKKTLFESNAKIMREKYSNQSEIYREIFRLIE